VSEPTGAQAAQHPVPQPANQTVRRNLPVAIAVGVVLYAWIVGTLLWWQWGFIVFLVASVVAGSFEITSALNKVRLNAVFTPVLIGAPVTFVVSHVVALRAGPLPAGAALLAGLALMVIASLIGRLRGPVRGYLADGAASLFTIAYLPLLLGSLILLLAQPQGNLRVICYFILVPCGDTSAYLVGSFLGRHKIAPHISPGKTWEGLAGGVAVTGLIGALVAPALIGAHWWAGALIGVLLAVSGAVGDLIESMIKRDTGLKDMSRLLPGHGGAMDRLDSLLVAAPIAWAAMLLLVH